VIRLSVPARAAIVATALWVPLAGLSIAGWRTAEMRRIEGAEIASCKSAALQRNEAPSALTESWNRCYLLLPSMRSPEQVDAERNLAFLTAAAIAAGAWAVALLGYVITKWILAGRPKA
jgi:hypothetical protein